MANYFDHYDSPAETPEATPEPRPLQPGPRFDVANAPLLPKNVSDIPNTILRGAVEQGLLAPAEGVVRGGAQLGSEIGSGIVKRNILGDEYARLGGTLGELQRAQMMGESPQRAQQIQQVKSRMGEIEAKAAPALAGAASVEYAGTKPLAEGLRSARETVEEKFPVTPEFQQSFGGMFLTGLAQAAGQLPTYMIPGLGPAMSLGQMYQEGYDDAKSKGADELTAQNAGAANVPASSLDYLADKTVLGRFLKSIKGKMTVGNLLKSIGASAATEGATEGAQQIWQNLVANSLVGYDKEREIDDQVVMSALLGALVGGTVSGVGSGIGAVRAQDLPLPATTTQPVPEERAAAGMSSEQPASAATNALTETQKVDLRKSEELTNDQFWAAFNARQAEMTGVKIPESERRIVSETVTSPIEIDPEEAKVAIDEGQAVLDQWREDNPNAPENITVVFDPNLQHNGYGIRGAFNPQTGEIIVNARYATTAEAVTEVLNHEWAHATISTAEGLSALANFAQQQISTEDLNRVQERYPQRANESNERYKLRLVDEWIAENQEKAPGVMARIVQQIREWLFKISGGKIALTPQQAARVLLRTLREQETGRIQPETEADTATTGEPAEQFSLTQTKTPEFKKWFGDSKVVDENGNPQAMYHGTSFRIVPGDEEGTFSSLEDFTTFKPNEKGLIFVSPNPQFASSYATNYPGVGYKYQEGSRVYKTYVRAENPFDYENPEHIRKIFGDERLVMPRDNYSGQPISRENVVNGDWSSIEQLSDKIRKAGFDGLYVFEDNIKNLAVFSPDQIKSATGNVGAYGQRPITAEEAARAGMTEQEANDAQKGGDIRFALTEDQLRKAAMSQRGVPENQMMDSVSAIQDAGGPAVYNDLLEHVGDLSHRLQEPRYQGASAQSKIEKLNRLLNPAPDRMNLEQEIEHGLRSNAEYALVQKYGLEDVRPIWKAYDQVREQHASEIENMIDAARNAMREEGEKYAKAHEDENKPVTYAGRLGRDAAIALGRMDFDALRKISDELKSFYDQHAGSDRIYMTEPEAGQGTRFALTQDQIDAIDGKMVRELDIPALRQSGVLSDRYASMLESLIDEFGGDTRIKTVAPRFLPDRAAGSYNVNQDLIRVSTASKLDLGRLILHEYVHGLTLAGLNYAKESMNYRGEIVSAVPRFGVSVRELQDASRRMDDLFDTAKKAAEERGEEFYGLKNVQEFVAETFSNQKFQKFLSSIPATGTGSKVSLFDKFVSIVRQILGVDDQSLLTDVISATEPLVGAKKKTSRTLMVDEPSRFSLTEEPENLNKIPDEKRPVPESRFYVASDERGGDFADAIARAAQDHPRGAAVEVKPREFYTDPANFLFLSEDGLGGVAVKPDGDLVSVFKHPDSKARMKNILADASKYATKLDAFDIDAFLPQLYANFGFRPVARVAFNDEYAPPRWNFDDMGRPDVVLMVKDPDNVLGLPDATLYTDEVREQVPLVSYDEAGKLQQEALDKLKEAKKEDTRFALTEEPVENIPEEDDEDFEEIADKSSVLGSAAKREREELPPTSALNTLYAKNSSVPLPTQGKRTNGQVAEQFRQAAREYWGREVNAGNITPEELNRLVDNAVEEVRAGLKARNHAGNWYTIAIRKAMAIAKVLHPELRDDAAAQKAGFEDAYAAEIGLALAMAITSQNLNVQKNTQYANEQFEILKKTGRFDPAKEYGSKGEAISGNLELANTLLDKVGWNGVEDFLNREYTVKELSDIASKALGKKVSIVGKVDDVVNGSAIFGPKIGGGFFQNLRANFNPVTVDLWMRRTWGRWTGDVLPKPLDANRLARMLVGMRESGIQLPEELRSIRTVIAKKGRKVPTLTENTAKQILSDPEAVSAAYDFAAQQDARWNKIYSEVRQNLTPEQAEAVRNGTLSLEQLNRQQQKSLREKQEAWLDLEDRPSLSSKEGKDAQKELFAKMDAKAGRTAALTKEELSDLKPEWAKAARVVTTLLKPVDVPSDIDRRVIVDVVNRVRNELDRQGIKATNADIQAILWYPEKDIWAKLAGKPESKLKSSYDEEFLRVAESKGLGKEARDAAAGVRD